MSSGQSKLKLSILKLRYNRLVQRLNRINRRHAEVTQPLYRQRDDLYREIYNISAQPTQDMIKRVEAKLTLEEKKYARVLWNTPPAIEDLEELWVDD